MKRVRAVVATALVLAVGAVPRAAAEPAVSEVGWWTSSPFASAPEGGVAVGNAPNGPSSVAAVRLDLGRGVTGAATLRLEEAGGFAQEVASIQACRGDDAWQAADGGPLEDAPEDRCGTSPVLLEETEGVWTVDVAALIGGDSTATVMLLPGPGSDPTGTLGLGWEVQFHEPSLSATEVAGGGGGGGSGGAGGTAPVATTPTTAGSSTGVTPTTARSTPSPRPAGGGGQVTVTTAGVVDEQAEGAEVDSGVGASAGVVVAPGGPAEGRPWGQFGLFMILSALVGAVAGAGRWVATLGSLARVPVLRAFSR
ncbi:MAG: hypothetical protein HYU28_03880 [Actinobacteria bacterium]|nr:hypothetical protein [Actinomycetota bacterium]